MLYFAFVNPHLEYCITSWGVAYPTTIFPLAQLQKKAVRLMCFKNKTEHTDPIFKQLEILPLKKLYFVRICCLVKRYLSTDNQFSISMFQRCNATYNTRFMSCSNNLLVPGYTKGRLLNNSFFMCISYIGPVFYNKLSDQYKSLCYAKFVSTVKKFAQEDLENDDIHAMIFPFK